MTVYVDEFRRWAPGGPRCFSAGSSHMTADTLDELHAMADRIGLRRAWFQGQPAHRVPHYDLTRQRRSAALLAGAVFVPAKAQARARVAARRVAAAPASDERVRITSEIVGATGETVFRVSSASAEESS